MHVCYFLPSGESIGHKGQRASSESLLIHDICQALLLFPDEHLQPQPQGQPSTGWSGSEPFHCPCSKHSSLFMPPLSYSRELLDV